MKEFIEQLVEIIQTINSKFYKNLIDQYFIQRFGCLLQIWILMIKYNHKVV